MLGRRGLLLAGAAFGLLGCASASRASVGRSISVDVVDRETGRELEVHTYRGRRFVAGRPGARYAIRIANRSGVRIMVVTSVDGVNVLSGQTAAWNQTGYVLDPRQSYDISGWRKSDREVAAFEFAALPDSYAARTGRPHDVGVIGVALFRERERVRTPAAPPMTPMPSRGALESRGDRDVPNAAQESAAPPESRAEANDRPAPSARRSAQSDLFAGGRATAQPEPDDAARERSDRRVQNRLGTAHGAREDSRVVSTHFERASSTPDELIAIQYDRYENLVAAGVIAAPLGRPRAFPRSDDMAGFVPDPPARY